MTSEERLGVFGEHQDIKATAGFVFQRPLFFPSICLVPVNLSTLYFSVCRRLFLWGMRLLNINRGSNLNLEKQWQVSCNMCYHVNNNPAIPAECWSVKEALTVGRRRLVFCRTVPSRTAASLDGGSSSPGLPDRCSWRCYSAETGLLSGYRPPRTPASKDAVLLLHIYIYICVCVC